MGGEARDSHAELPRMFGRRVAGSPAPATRGGESSSCMSLPSGICSRVGFDINCPPVMRLDFSILGTVVAF